MNISKFIIGRYYYGCHNLISEKNHMRRLQEALENSYIDLCNDWILRRSSKFN